MGNAQLWIATYKGMIRYCPELEQWLVRDGQRWKRDAWCDVERLAKLVIRGLYREAREQDNYSKRDALIKWALRSETAKMVRDMLFLARSDPSIRIIHGEL
jgi:putative DNA primase/helicase